MSNIKKFILTLALLAAFPPWAFAQVPGPISNLAAAPGPFPGTVKLTWSYPETQSSGLTIYVQYDTNAGAAWDSANAQIIAGTGPVTMGTQETFYVGGLDAGYTGGANTSPQYHFHVWIENGIGVNSGSNDPGTARAYVPAAFTLTSQPMGDALLRRMNYPGNKTAKHAALDSQGNVYEAESAFMNNASSTSTAAVMVVKKIGPAGQLLWQKYFNAVGRAKDENNPSTLILDEPNNALYVFGTVPTYEPGITQGVMLKYDLTGALLFSKFIPAYKGLGYNSMINAAARAGGSTDMILCIDEQTQQYSGPNTANAYGLWLQRVDQSGAELDWLEYQDISSNSYTCADVVWDPSGVLVAGTYSPLNDTMNYTARRAALWKFSPGLFPDAYISPAAEYLMPLSTTVAYSEARALVTDPMLPGQAYMAGIEQTFGAVGQGANMFLAKFTTMPGPGIPAPETTRYTSPGNYRDEPLALAMDSLSNIFVAGFENGGNPFQGRNALGFKFTSSLQLLSTAAFVTAGDDAFGGVAISSMGAAYLSLVSSNSTGVYALNPPADNPNNFTARTGWETGSVWLNWTIPQYIAVSTLTAVKIQYSTSSAGPWNPAAAQLQLTAPLSNLPPVWCMMNSCNASLSGFEAGRDAAGSITSPFLYFKTWMDTTAGLFEMGPVTGASPNTPNLTELAFPGRDSVYNSYAGVANAAAAALARDAAGNIYQAFSGNTPNSGQTLLIRKSGPAGQTLWTKFYSSTYTASYQVNALAVDAAGNIILGGSENTMPGAVGGDPNIWIVKLDPQGRPLWRRVVGGTGGQSDAVYAVKADPATGAVYAAGSVYSVGTSSDAWLAKYAPNGTPVYEITTSSAGTEHIYALALTADGSVYAAGDRTVGGQQDGFVRKFNPSAGKLWEAGYAGFFGMDDGFNGLAVDPVTGNIVAAGFESVSAGVPAALISSYTAAGAELGSRTFMSPGDGSAALGLALDGAGNAYLTGYEDRTTQGQGRNIWNQKVRLDDYSVQWVRTFDTPMATGGSSEEGRGIVIDQSGSLYVSFLSGLYSTPGFGRTGTPGLFKFSQPYVGLTAREARYTPSGVELSWITDRELLAGASFFVIYSTSPQGPAAGWRAPAQAQLIISTGDPELGEYIPSGEYLTLTVGGLEAGRNGSGAQDSPVYNFKVWYTTATSGDYFELAGQATAQALAPYFSEGMNSYADGKLFFERNTSGNKPGMAIDKAGNLLMLGSYYSSGGAGTAAGSSAGYYGTSVQSAVLKKYFPDGRLQWVRYYSEGDSYYTELRGVTADNAGNIYAAGKVWTSDYWSSEPERAVLLKYDASGRLLWRKSYQPVTAGDDATATSVAADQAGNAYLAGGEAVADQGENLMVAKFSPDGVQLHAALYRGAADYDDEAQAIDVSTFVYVAGWSVEVWNYNTFIGKFNASDLSTLAAQTGDVTGAGSSNWANAVKIAGDGSVYAAGAAEVAGNWNFMALRLDANLSIPPAAPYWADFYDTSGGHYQDRNGIALDSFGNVYFSGADYRYDEGLNALIRKYTPDGQLIWSRSVNSGNWIYDEAYSVAVDSAGGVYFNGTLGGQYGLFKYRPLAFTSGNPMLTVQVSTPMPAGLMVAVIPMLASGGLDPSMVAIGAPSGAGYFQARLPGGAQYFVGLTAPDNKPTIKDQLMDPYGSFMVQLLDDTTVYRAVAPKGSADDFNTLHARLANVAINDLVMAEVSYSLTGEKVAYALMRATDTFVTMQVFNVPSAPGGTYNLGVSIPGKNRNFTGFMPAAFPGINGVTVDMNDAQYGSGFSVGGSTIAPSFQGVVKSTAGAPLQGANVRVYQEACGSGGCAPALSFESLTDTNGKFVFYNLPMSAGSYNSYASMKGYRNDNFGPFPIAAAGMTHDFELPLATYTLSGLVRYNGVPLPNAYIKVYGDGACYDVGSVDSYHFCNSGMQSNAAARTGADGAFFIGGLTDGNARLMLDFMGTQLQLNDGSDQTTRADDIRVTIASDTARIPNSPEFSPCDAVNNVWKLDNSGNCLEAGRLKFDLTQLSGNSLGAIYGTVNFITTYTVSAQQPLEIAASSPVVIMASEDCNNGCADRKLGFAAVSGLFTSNVATYTVTLSSGVFYRPKIQSPDWGMLASFNDGVDLRSTDTARMDFTVTRSGGLKGTLFMPDGTVFKPVYGEERSTSSYQARVEVRGRNVQFSDGWGVDDYGSFEFPNLAPGIYDVTIRPEGSGARWAPLHDVYTVIAGRVTEARMRLESGLAVQPQILGLPAISTAAWNYSVIAVPSGTNMNRQMITELFFSNPEYAFGYSTAAASWDKRYMAPGQYDFYLLLGASYCEDPAGCGDKGQYQNFNQFANFIGRAKNVAVQKSDSNPTLGTFGQPIPVSILGAIGQASMTGRVRASKLFTDQDFEKIFANFETEIMPLIPSVMLYDTAGDLRGFGHAMPDEQAITGFKGGIAIKDKDVVISTLAAHPLRYMVWGVPPGRYTAVFANPNYPPVSKEIELPANAVYDFSFDEQNIPVGTIAGVVRSSSTGAAVENASVQLKHRTVEKFAVTDSSGAFSFDNLPSGIFRLEVSKDGFVTAGVKTSLAGGDSASFAMSLVTSESRILGKVYMSKFPSASTKAGVRMVAFDETMNVQAPSSYLPKIEVKTGEDGTYELRGVVPGHSYKVTAFYDGKLAETLFITAEAGNTQADDMVLRDIPPQVTVKVRKSPDSASKVDIIIRSPKQLVSTPVCKYNPGELYDSTAAVSLALVPAPNNSYQGQFTVSRSQQYYTVYVSAGDNSKMSKTLLYDQTNDARTEQYIQDAAIAGGEIQMDTEREEYSGLELDAGALTYSTAAVSGQDFSGLVGGFFSALPSVRTIKTSKGNLNLETALKDLMASEVYNMDLSNAQANKPFTLTLKYDKEKVTRTGSLRIYQYDEVSGQWKEVPGNYTVDPMTGVVSVDVRSLDGAYRGTDGSNTPLERKQFHMSAVKDGRYVTSAAASSSQSGKFAVFTAKPATGTPAFSAGFEVYNMPNPFSLKAKTVNVSTDGQAVLGAAYTTSGTLIKYNLPAGKSGDLKFVIYNLAGEKVRTLDEGARAGNQVYYSEWDGRNDNGVKCASGVYFMLAFQEGKKLGSKAHKMAIIK